MDASAGTLQGGRRMTYRHECRNCRWCYQVTYDRHRCAKADSGRNNVDVRDWCGKWEHEETKQSEQAQNAIRKE